MPVIEPCHALERVVLSLMSKGFGFQQAIRIGCRPVDERLVRLVVEPALDLQHVAAEVETHGLDQSARVVVLDELADKIRRFVCADACVASGVYVIETLQHLSATAVDAEPLPGGAVQPVVFG